MDTMDKIDFKFRTYGWQELAILYAPELTSESAGKRLSKWVAYNPQLTEALQCAGWRKGKKILTPLQVKVLIQYLGEP